MLSTNAHAASLNSSEHLSPASYPPANRTLPPGATAVSQQRPVPAWPPTSTPTTSSPTASTPSPWLTSRRAPHRRCSNSTGHRGTHHTAALAALTGQPFGPSPALPRTVFHGHGPKPARLGPGPFSHSFPWARPEIGPVGRAITEFFPHTLCTLARAHARARHVFAYSARPRYSAGARLTTLRLAHTPLQALTHSPSPVTRQSSTPDQVWLAPNHQLGSRRTHRPRITVSPDPAPP